jgi:hypothetical protein
MAPNAKPQTWRPRRSSNALASSRRSLSALPFLTSAKKGAGRSGNNLTCATPERMNVDRCRRRMFQRQPEVLAVLFSTAAICLCRPHHGTRPFISVPFLICRSLILFPCGALVHAPEVRRARPRRIVLLVTRLGVYRRTRMDAPRTNSAANVGNTNLERRQ